MPLKFLIILILISARVYANISHLTCSKNGTNLIYINGVDINNWEHTKFESLATGLSSDLLPRNIDAKDDFFVTVPHNRSEGLLRDIAESFFLFANRGSKTKLSNKVGYSASKKIIKFLVAGLMSDRGKLEYLCNPYIKRDSNGELINKICLTDPVPQDPNAPITEKNICCSIDKIKMEAQKSVAFEDLGKFRTIVVEKLKNDQKVILVTHSAGAMFADRIKDYVKRYYPQYSDYLGTLAIARPFRSNHKENEYFLNSQKDPVLNQINETGINETPAPNLFFKTNCDIEVPFPVDYRNHDFSCYLSEAALSPGVPLLFNTPNPTSRYYIKDYIYRVASDLGNNDVACCNKAAGKIWINNGDVNGGFISKNIEISGKVMIESGAQLCGSGVITASNDPTKHVFQKDVIINGKLDLNSSFSFSGNTQTSENSKLVSEPGVSFLLLNTNVTGEINFKPSASSTVGNYQNIIGGTIAGQNKLMGPVTLSGSNVFKDVDVYTMYRPLTLTNFAMNGMGSLKLTNKRQDAPTTIQNVVLEAPLAVSSSLLDLNGSKILGATSVISPDIVQIPGVEFRGTTSISSGSSITLSGKFKNFSGSCDNYIHLLGSNITDSLQISNCDYLTGYVNSNGPLTLEGTYNISAQLLGGGSLVGSKSQVNNVAAYVTGTTNVSAPSRFDMKGGFGFSQYIVNGNVNYVSSSPCGAQLLVEGPYNGDISATLSGNSTTSYCSGSSQQCTTYGTCGSFTR